MSRIGTIRRLQALAAIGWTRAQVAEAMGVGCWLLSRATFGRGDVDRRQAREVYESLRGGPAHPGRHYLILAALVLIAAARHLTRKAAEHLLEEWS